MIRRPFTTGAELKTLIQGYTLLFGAEPAEITIKAIDRQGFSTCIPLTDGSELWPSSGAVRLVSIGRSRIVVAWDAERSGREDQGSVNLDQVKRSDPSVVRFEVTFS